MLFRSADVNFSERGTFSYSSGAATTGVAEITWDGNDGTAEVLNPTGLGGVNLTLGGDNAFAIRATSDLGADLVLTVYTDQTNFSSAILSVPADNTFMFQDYTIPFASFLGIGGSGADFTNVGAISLTVVGSTPNVDVSLDFIKTIPEPTDRKSTRLNSSHMSESRMPSSA